MTQNEPLSGGTGSPEPSTPAHPRSKSERCRNILFVCLNNSVVSIMAEALFNRWAGKGFRAFSAGSRPTRAVDPRAVELLKANQIWSQGLRPKNCDEFLGQDATPIDLVISLGSQTPHGLPSSWAGNPRVIHWRISEPRVDGKPAEKASAFRKTFTELETRIKLFALVNQRAAQKKVAA